MYKKVIAILVASILFLNTCENAEALTYSPITANNVEDILAMVGEVRFSEDIKVLQRPKTNTIGLTSLTEMYVPVSTEIRGMKLSEMNMYYKSVVTYIYKNKDGEFFSFEWTRHFATAYAEHPEGFRQYASFEEFAAIRNFGYYGDTSEQIVERNGITYGILDKLDSNTGKFRGYLITWAQYGESFEASIPTGVSLDEAIHFCYVRPVNSWEIYGKAVSVSIQGMEEVSILDNEGNEILVEDDVLYKINPSANPDTSLQSEDTEQDKTRIGYRWLIDEDSLRYQYVLNSEEEYTFQAEGVISTPEVLVKYFEGGEVISNEDYTQAFTEQNSNRFELTVMPKDQKDVLMPIKE